MLEINNLFFSYDEKTSIFENLSVTFAHQTTAIIGQNGAGKSTLVKLIKGLLRQQSGEILLEGTSLSDVKASQIASKIGLVFQNPNDQIFKSNVLDEVMFGPMQLGKSQEESKSLALDALNEVELLELKDENPYDLNLSDRKLISIASILAMNPDIIIFDEPTIAQDAHGKKLIEKIIQRLKNDGKYVITIIHDMDFVARNFEDTIIIAKGNVLFQGATRMAFQQHQFLEQAKLELPFVTKLGHELGVKEVILTVDELVEKIK